MTVDVHDKQSVIQFYNNVYKAPLPLPFWSGDIATCDAGQVNAEFRQDVIDRVNYYRAMTGVPATVTLSSTHAGDPQNGALMMSAANSLSHTPANTWPCWTQDGADAAAASNLALGSYGPQAIDGYMFDWGSNNTEVGHRRWIHFPTTLTMDTGDVPGSSANFAANALSIFPIDSDPNPVTRNPYIAWPNEGYVPYQLTPARWSFRLPGASMNRATVSISIQGQTTNVSIEHTGSDYLVWLVDANTPTDSQYSWPRPTATEDTYTVSIDNVMVSGNPQNFQYEVKVFDPEAIIADADGDGVAETQDYDQVNRSATSSFWQVNDTDTASQIINPGTNGTLTQVSLPVSCEGGGLALEITGVTNGIPDNTAVLSKSIGAEEVNSADGRQWRSFVLDTPYPVTTGQLYAIRIKPGVTCNWSASDSLYAAGAAYITRDGTRFTLAGNADYPFETIVLPQQLDNCPATPNPDQQDSNSNGVGDACEAQSLTCNGKSVTVQIALGETPTSGSDVILGTNGNDNIAAMGGDDTICGLAGNDTIIAGNGNDWVDAGPGDDMVEGGNGNDEIYGDSGVDVLNGGPHNDEIYGENDGDFIKGNSGDDTLDGGPGVDQIKGGSGNDIISTGPGGNRDTVMVVTGGAGNDIITGGVDADEIRGETGNDTILGDDGADALYGGGGNDSVNGQDGDDLLRGNGSKDTVIGGYGNDDIDGGDSDDILLGGAGNDVMRGATGNDDMSGGADKDEMYGGGGNDIINGNRGNDKLFGGGSNDTLNGGSGIDSCDGENGIDTSSACETTTNFP